MKKAMILAALVGAAFAQEKLPLISQVGANVGYDFYQAKAYTDMKMDKGPSVGVFAKYYLHKQHALMAAADWSFLSKTVETPAMFGAPATSTDISATVSFYGVGYSYRERLPGDAQLALFSDVLAGWNGGKSTFESGSKSTTTKAEGGFGYRAYVGMEKQFGVVGAQFKVGYAGGKVDTADNSSSNVDRLSIALGVVLGFKP